MNDVMIDEMIGVMTAKVVDAAVMIVKVVARKTMVLVDRRGSGGSTTVCAV